MSRVLDTAAADGSVMVPDEVEPTVAELDLIEAELPLIEAGVALIDAEIRARAYPSELSRRRVRRAKARVAREAIALYSTGGLLDGLGDAA